MKREFLEELGLDKEAIDKIMAENGKDIQAEQKKVSQLETENESVKAQLKEANETIDSYKDMNIDEIKQSVEEWKTKAEENRQALETTKKVSALEKELMKTKTVDVEILKNLINIDELKFDGETITGLDKQVANLKESKPFLFEKEDTANPFILSNSQTSTPTAEKTDFGDYAESTRLIK